MKSAFFQAFRRLLPLASLTGLAVTDQAIVSGMNFAVAIYLAKALGMEAFGSFSIILVLLFFFLEIFRSVIIAPMITFAAQDNSSGYMRSVLLLAIVAAVTLSLIGSSTISLSERFFPQWGVGGLGFLTFWLIAGRLLQEIMRRYLFIDARPGSALGMDSAASLIIVMGLALLTWAGKLTLAHVVAVHGAAYTLSAVSQMLFSFRDSTRFSFDQLDKTARQHWEFGRWLIAGAVAMYASSNLLLLMAATILGSDAAGLIKTAQYTMGGMIVLFQAVENIIPFRFASHVRHKNKKRLVESFQASLGAMLTFCIVHGMIIYLFLDRIAAWLNVADKPVFEKMVVLNILFSTILTVSYCLQYALRAFENTKPVFIASFMTACLSIAFGAILIQWGGVVGVLYGFLTFQIVTCLIYGFFLKQPWSAMR